MDTIPGINGAVWMGCDHPAAPCMQQRQQLVQLRCQTWAAFFLGRGAFTALKPAWNSVACPSKPISSAHPILLPISILLRSQVRASSAGESFRHPHPSLVDCEGCEQHALAHRRTGALRPLVEAPTSVTVGQKSWHTIRAMSRPQRL